MSNMTFPCVNPIQLVPTIQKSSLHHHFKRNSWKLGSQKLLAQAHFLTASKFPRAYLDKNVKNCETSNTQKWPHMSKKMAKNDWNCGTTYLDPKSKNNCILFSSTFHVERPVSRYGRLELKFLCERFSHCIYSFCSIELTKTRNTWSLTAVWGALG